jgi:hypothetical protein
LTISVYQLEERIFDYFDTIFGSQKSLFGFADAASACFFVDRQTNAPRIAACSLLFYRVGTPETLGNSYSDYNYLNRTTGIESIDFHRQVHVTVNVLSKQKGSAKGALSFLQLMNQTSRHYEASYNTGDFDLPLHRIDPNMRDLSFLENASWDERVEADFYFNYTDVVSLSDVQSMVRAPSSVYATKDKVDFTIDTI